MISVILFKMGKQSDCHLNFFQIVAWRDFTVVTKLMIKHFSEANTTFIWNTYLEVKIYLLIVLKLEYL